MSDDQLTAMPLAEAIAHLEAQTAALEAGDAPA